MSVTIMNAERVPVSLLTLLWNEGFSNYYVPMQLGDDRLGALIEREAISLADSHVAMLDGEPVGFVLTGIRWRDGRMLGFDGGTAVLPWARGRGIGRQLMQRFIDHLQEIGAEEAVLTVVSANQPAIKLYEQLGFERTRDLICMRAVAVNPLARERVTGLVFRKCLPTEVQYLALRCYQHRPEWQNDCSGSKEQKANAIIAELNGKPVGYAIYQEAQSILLYQLGVLPEYRQNGIGSQLLQSILQASGTCRVSYLNHPKEETAATDFLLHRGFESFLEQVEMRMLLQPRWHPLQATAEDIGRIKRALRAAELPVAGVDEHFPSFWMLEGDDGSLLGTVGAEISGKSALLRSLSVRRDVRGQGLGKRLVAHEERVLRSMGVYDVYIVTTTADVLFGRIGYMRITREDVPPEVFKSSQFQGACPLTAVVMHKPLV